MVASLDLSQYNSAFQYQRNDFRKTEKRLTISWNFFPAKRFLSALLKRFNGLLMSHLLASKGTISDLKENIQEIEGKDLSKQISDLEEFILFVVSSKETINTFISSEKGKEYPELVITNSSLEELIDNLYSIQRIFKKHTLQTPKKPSEVARELSRTSVKSLEKALYGN